jgi:exoribonuclease II
MSAAARQSFRIPKRLQLMGQTIRVRVIRRDRWKHGKDSIGAWDPARLTIDILAGQPRTIAEQVYFHELAHAVATMQSHPLASDETFIDQQGHLYHQAFTSSTY